MATPQEVTEVKWKKSGQEKLFKRMKRGARGLHKAKKQWDDRDRRRNRARILLDAAEIKLQEAILKFGLRIGEPEHPEVRSIRKTIRQLTEILAEN